MKIRCFVHILKIIIGTKIKSLTLTDKQVNMRLMCKSHITESNDCDENITNGHMIQNELKQNINMK